jgi:uncharacterized protein YjiS (DUF1127 family)
MTSDLMGAVFSPDQTDGSRRTRRLAAVLAGLLDRARLAYAEGRRRRRHRRVLLSLPDRMLSDIGLSEAEIADLRAGEPFPRMRPEELGPILPR